MPNSTIPPVNTLVQEAVKQAEEVSARVRSRAESCRRRAIKIEPEAEAIARSEAPTKRIRIPTGCYSIVNVTERRAKPRDP